MNRKGQNPPPGSRRRSEKMSRPPDMQVLRGEGPDSCPTETCLSDPPESGRCVAAVSALLALAVALAFGQTVHHGFILHYDDHEYVCANQQVTGGVTARGIVWAFTHFYSANWHPLTWLSHMLDCQLYGLEHPGGHHLTNVLLH